jgi:DNA repair protein RadC
MRTAHKRGRPGAAVEPRTFADVELLEVLLRGGPRSATAAREAAVRLLHRFGGLEGLARASPAAMADAVGAASTDHAGAWRIAIAIAMGERLSERRCAPRRAPPVRTSAAVAELMAPKIGHLEHEEMWVVALDGRSAARGTRRVAQGGLHGLTVSARDILRAALLEAASAFVLVHNHPSGDPLPSPEDVAMTHAVREAADVVGTPLVDHVVVARGLHASLLDLGHFDGL